MRAYPKKKKITEKGLHGSLLKLADIPKLPAETYRLVEETAARVGNTDVLSYSINAVVSTYVGNVGGYKMDPDKAMSILCIALEQSCYLHSPELEISATHMTFELKKLGVLTSRKRFLEETEEKQSFSRNYVRLASFWRKHGGGRSWRGTDAEIMKRLIVEHGDDLDRVFAAIAATRSIQAPFVAAMDSVATPLALGAL